MEKFFTNPGLYIIGESILKDMDYQSLICLHKVFDQKCLYTILHHPWFWYEKTIFRWCSGKIQDYWSCLISKTECSNLERSVVCLIIQVLKEEDTFDTPLQSAAKYGFFDVVQFLLEELDHSNILKQFNHYIDSTPIHDAAQFGHFEIFMALLPYIDQAHARDECGNTPFELALGNGHMKIVQVLLDGDRSQRYLV